MIKKAGWLAVTASLVLSMAGTVSAAVRTAEDEEEGPLNPEEEEELEQAEKAAEAEEAQEKESDEEVKEPLKIALSIPDSQTDSLADQAKYIGQKLEELGYIVDLRFAWGEASVQMQDIEKWTEEGVDLMIINPVEPEGLAESLEAAGEAKIPILCLEKMIDNTQDVDYFITYDYLGLGKKMGEYIKEQAALEDASEENPRTIEFLMGAETDAADFLFYTGLMEGLSPYLEDGKLISLSGKTDFEDVGKNGQTFQEAQDRMSWILEDYYPEKAPDIICTASDQLAEIAVWAVQDADYEEKKVSSEGSEKDKQEDTAGSEAEKSWPLITGQGATVSGMNNLISQKQAVTSYGNVEKLAQVCAETADAILKDKEIENSVEQYDNGLMIVPAILSEFSLVDISNYQEILIDTGVYEVEQQIKIP